MNEWKNSLRFLRAISATPEFSAQRARAAAAAHAFLAQCADPHLSKLAPLLTPQVSDKQLLCALVPVERHASRERLSDADFGISTNDSNFTPLTVNHSPLTQNSNTAVVADNIRSALNIGGIFRTCAFFGVSRLWLCGYTATPENPHVAKSAMGAEKTVAWRRADTATDAIASLRSEGFTIHALETAQNATDVAEWTPCHASAIVIGNERFGLDPETVALCDGALAIRGAGAKNSLNVVCALAVALHRL